MCHTLQKCRSQNEARLLSQLCSVKITDSWAKHDKVDLKLPGEHFHASKAAATSSVALWPPVLQAEGQAATPAAAATATAAQMASDTIQQAKSAELQAKLDELEDQNTRLTRDLMYLKSAKEKSAAQRREQRQAARDNEEKLTRQIAELSCEVRRLESESAEADRNANLGELEAIETLKMQVQRQQTEIASLKSNDACMSSQLASMKRRMLSASTQRDSAQSAERAAAMAKVSAERETASLRSQLEALTERLTDLARQRETDRGDLKKAEQAAATATEEAAAAERESAEAAAEARSAAAAVQTELLLREQEIDTLRERLVAAQAETRDASAAADRIAQQVAAGESEEVAGLKQRLAALRSDLCAAQQAAETARGAVFQEQKKTARSDAEIAQWKDRMARVQAENKTLFNTILDLKGNIRVFARIRPMGATGNGDATVPAAVAASSQRTLTVQQGGTEKKFKFDHVFDSASTQEQVFSEVAPLVRSVLDGYNVCVFAYGQTGAGKTHTMQGSDTAPGVNVRALNDLFALASDRAATMDTRIAVSMCEIYNERVRDLLVRGGLQGAKPDLTGEGGVAVTSPAAAAELVMASASGKRKPRARAGKVDPEGLDLKQNAAGGTYAHGLTWLQVKRREDIDAVFSAGTAARSVSSTASNDVSSRSHMVFCVEVFSASKLPGKRKQGTTCARLFLIDLAGSERLKKSLATGARQAEAVAINKSLSALGDVMSSLQGKSAHIPFRNSKLTLLLKDALGGNNKALMFAAVSPHTEDSAESLCSLAFAKRAGKVELGGAQRAAGGGGNSTRSAGAAASGPDASIHGALTERLDSLQAELARVREAEAAKDGELDTMAAQVRILEQEHEKQQADQDEELSDLRSKVARFSSLLDGLAGAPSTALSPVAGRRGGRRFSCVPMSAHKRKAIGDSLREIASPPAAFGRAPPMPPLPASPPSTSATPPAGATADSPASMPVTPSCGNTSASLARQLKVEVAAGTPQSPLLQAGTPHASPTPASVGQLHGSPEATDDFEALEQSVLEDVQMEGTDAVPRPAPASSVRSSPGRGTKRQREADAQVHDSPAAGAHDGPSAAQLARPAVGAKLAGRSRQAALRLAPTATAAQGNVAGAPPVGQGKTGRKRPAPRVGHRGGVLRTSSRGNTAVVGTAPPSKGPLLPRVAPAAAVPSTEHVAAAAADSAQVVVTATPSRSGRRKKFAHVTSKINTGRTPIKRPRRGGDTNVSQVR